jgi:protein-disulfide isomerase
MGEGVTQGRSSGRRAPMYLAVLGVFALVAVAGGWTVGQYRDAVRTAEQSEVNVRTIAHFYSLPLVAWPSEISPYRSISGTADFEDAPIRIVEYADPLCIDCRVLHEQLKQLEREFAGKINVAYQFFPLEAVCNDVVTKDKHPGACALSYMAAYDPARFRAIHDEIQDNMEAARSPAWQADLARRHGLEGALTDEALHARVHRLIRTGTEYEQTSAQYAHGIRSTPTLIINNRMIIGTLPTQQLRAIFAALVDQHERPGSAFLENWLDPGCVIEPDAGPPKPCGTP